MKPKAYWHRFVWHLAIALILAGAFWLIGPPPATAQSLEEYFQLTYEPVSFSKSKIQGNEAFYTTIQGRAICTKDLPFPVSEASITSQIVAEHTASGTLVTLNSSYTITIKPFPSKKGETAEINQIVPLKFPAQAESGDYTVIGKLIEAKAKIGFGWLNITGFLPQEQTMGSLKYTASQPKPTSTPTPKPTSIPTPTPTPTPTPASAEHVIPWWIWLAFAVAAITTVINIIWLLRRRKA